MRGRALPRIVAGVMLLGGLKGFAGNRAAGPIGSLVAQGTVRVGRQPAPAGSTLFAGDVVATEKGSVAVMTLRSGGTAALAPDGEVALTGKSGETHLSLWHGTLVVRAVGAQPVLIEVLGTPVSVRGEGGFPALCRIAAVGRTAAIFNDGGQVEIQGAGAPRLLAKGTYMELGAGPQGGGQLAGRVSGEIPAATVTPSGQTKEVKLKIQDAVNWNDLVTTKNAGRARIALIDGSFLNVGARSQMRIVKHDPESQQTEVEFTVGRMRGEVVKLTKPGASFQVRTQTAVIGVVGTTFLIWATDKFTRVWCIEGAVRVQGRGAAAGQITLPAGQFTVVPRGGPPGAATQASPSQLQAESNLTDVTGPGALAGGMAAGLGPVGHAASVPLSAGTLGATAGATIASAVAISRVDGAKSALTGASTDSANAQSSSSSAVQSAASAVNSLTNASAGVAGITSIFLSPSQPGCGCQ